MLNPKGRDSARGPLRQTGALYGASHTQTRPDLPVRLASAKFLCMVRRGMIVNAMVGFVCPRRRCVSVLRGYPVWMFCDNLSQADLSDAGLQRRGRARPILSTGTTARP